MSRWLIGGKYCLVVFLCLTCLLTSGIQIAATHSSDEVTVIMPRIAVTRGYPNLIQDFEAKTGNKVDLIMLPEKGYQQKVELELAVGGGAYDVVLAPVHAAGRWAGLEWITPVDDFINDPKWTDPQELKFDDFLTGPVKMFTMDGKLYGLPEMNATIIMYYRKDIFAAHGLARPPDSWQELLEVAQKIHTPQVGAIAMRGSRAREGVMWPFPMVLYGYGGSIVKNFPTDMHPVFDSPEAIGAAKYYGNLLRNYGFKGATSAHWSEVVTAIQQGKAAIMIDGAPLAGRVLDPEKSVVIGKIGFAVIPRGPVTRWPAAAGDALCIPVGSKKKKLAWEYIKWALSTETQIKNAVMNNETALTRKSVLDDPRYFEKFGWGNGEYIRIVKETFDKWMKPYYCPLTPEWGAVEDATGIAISKVIIGEENAETAFREANKELYEIYKRAGYFKE